MVTSRQNDLSGLVESVFNAPGMYGQGETISQPYTFALGVQYALFTLNRIALSYGYMGYGLVQTLIDMPVEDAFRGGVEIETDELDEDDMKQLHRFMAENKDWENLKTALKWKRLFGGAALIIETEDENTKRPFKNESIDAESVLRFIPADRWELTLTGSSVMELSNSGLHRVEEDGKNDIPYLYYMLPMHKSRVIRLVGKEAPSIIRQRLQGWGMSELERCVRSINSFIKFQNVIFELVDEAKIDIFKIQQFNESLMTAQGTQLVQKRIQLNAMLKNYKNATVMDKEDDFEQKQIVFGGLADIYQEFRQNLSGDVQIPEAKLFGQSASGFSSGQDTIENYNALVESGVRESAKDPIRKIIDLRCQQLFGFVPEYETKFQPLRVLSATEQEAVDTSKFNRAMQLFDRRLFTDKEVLDSLDKDKLLNICTEIQDGTRSVELPDPGEQMQGEDGEEEGKPGEKTNAIIDLLKTAAQDTREGSDRKDAAIMKWYRRKDA